MMEVKKYRIKLMIASKSITYLQIKQGVARLKMTNIAEKN